MRKLFAAATVAAVIMAGACGGGDDKPIDASDGDGPGGDGPPAGAPVTPLAPAAGMVMYQGSQRDFRTSDGTCKGRVAASMARGSFCFLAADDTVKCAGVTAGVAFGMTFSSIGQTGAEQIMIFFGDNGMCVTRTDRTVQCMGTNQNAFGGTLTTTFASWAGRSDLAAIATGTWDQICGITTAGQVYCGGNPGGSPDYGQPPRVEGGAGQTGLWVDTGGAARLSDPMVLRPGESRTECTVQQGGLICGGTPYGPGNGMVVNGSRVAATGGDIFCWLASTGTVGCSTGTRFAGGAGKVLFLAANHGTDSMCAIYNDGSIWCIGTNTNGKLGTGNTSTLATETMVAPPGTAQVRCD